MNLLMSGLVVYRSADISLAYAGFAPLDHVNGRSVAGGCRNSIQQLVLKRAAFAYVIK